ncbi:endolytic transglycosylase MltG [Thermus filiformis]|uniref:Endolytic murein transglycosylase n=1 Tax=Thermus filiformis TaxID=276 RepID=A0A0A2WR00_THEFI|nr:endolytic transglycosylase MltG [Thermus filiformis]KGQ22233.1 4-amino-4-deoxychorismate lyase [Thermus filiformis]
MPEGRSWVLRGVYLLFTLFFLLLAYTLWLLGPTGKEALVRLEPGWDATRVAKLLEEKGLVRSGRLFAYYLRFSRRDRLLVPGAYRLRGEGAFRLARAISGGQPPLSVTLTFPEGLRAVDYAHRLKEAGLDGDGFLDRVRNPGPLKPPYVEGESLEGFLFPATYTFGLLDTPEEVVRAMLRRFEAELTPLVREKLRVRGLSVQAWVTLASIVQVEAGKEEEMPLIAGVFLNRLEQGMPLQADPTVAYALGKPLPELSRKAGDFGVDSPYNTYRYPGLPPTPISNPGRAALLSVLDPVLTDEKGRPLLYFFHAQGRLFTSPDFATHLRLLSQHRP